MTEFCISWYGKYLDNIPCIPKELQDLYLLVSLTIIACLISRFCFTPPHTPPKKKNTNMGTRKSISILRTLPVSAASIPFFPKPVSTLYVFFQYAKWHNQMMLALYAQRQTQHLPLSHLSMAILPQLLIPAQPTRMPWQENGVPTSKIRKRLEPK